MYIVKKKVKAFTLTELMVVLVISAIVMSLAITVMHLVQQHISGIQQNSKFHTEIRLLERVLQSDFSRSTEVQYHPKDSVLICRNSMVQNQYHFRKQYILRNSDTIALGIKSIVPYASGKTVMVGGIDALELELSWNVKPISLFVFKTNDANFYMQ